ncbi:MAG: methyltransferase [Arachnia propionica]|nr:MAG: methyltransferase [Arachnia propionica]
MKDYASTPGAPDARSWEYADDYAPLPDIISEARDEAILAGVRPISLGVAATLRVLARLMQANAVIEIGTAMGASGLAFLSGMADGVLTSIDAEPEPQLIAKQCFAKAGYSANQYRLIAGNPLGVLPKLRDGAYDIVFINGDKVEYGEYVAEASRLLRPGGLLAMHDCLWFGEVAEAAPESDEAIIIGEALAAITEAKAYEQALLPVGNGLLVAVKN